eukprot:GSMAST32.ASY1.ANO1.1948.1 assembled CDS
MSSPVRKKKKTETCGSPTRRPQLSYISLTTHPKKGRLGQLDINWGESDASKRGPIVASVDTPAAQDKVDRDHTPELETTVPPVKIGPFPQWADPSKVGAFDPFGHEIVSNFVKSGKMEVDGKAAIEPVWYLPEIARRFGCQENHLRQSLFEQTNGMYPELMTRPDLKCFLPPMYGFTIKSITDPNKELTVRVHDECNGSDVFGSDICTCRPYLIHAIQLCVETAQKGGAGVCMFFFFFKFQFNFFSYESRCLGEVTKYLVYNLRKRQEGGDSASQYFNCTERVAGVQDIRFQSMMPDALHWLGITQIDNFVSMSDMKYNAIVNSDAQVEIQAKVFAGYDAGDVYDANMKEEDLEKVLGRTRPTDTGCFSGNCDGCTVTAV